MLEIGVERCERDDVGARVEEAEQVAYARAWADDDADRRSAIDRGYEAAP